MAFSFGSNTQPAFGSNVQKPVGFGAPFGATTTTASSSFGGFGASTFGSTANQQQTTAFGSAFGAPTTAAATAAPAFGSTSFGAPTNTFGAPVTSAPAFGTAFGATTSTAAAAPAFGTGTGLFGTSLATSKPGLFSAPSSAPSLFSTSTTNAAPNLFSNQTPNLFGGGISSNTAPNLFGSVTTTSAPSLFGSTFGGATSSVPNLFGTTNSSTPGFGLFGGNATTTSTTSLFGTGGFGGFGGTQVSNFGARPTGPSQPPAQQQQQLVVNSIYNINIFNDERDDILKKWNLLQASWGTGKGYFNPSMPPVEYTVHNPYYRFKAIAYNVLPNHDNAEGLVKLIFNKKYSELSNQKQVLVNGIGGILGNKPNLKVTVQSITALSEAQSEVQIVVDEKGVTGSTRRIPATDLAAYLNQPLHKQQLNNVGVIAIVGHVAPSKTAREEYLRTVPLGFDPQMWKAAIADNPNPNKYLPVPMYGFGDLKARKLKQEHETGVHRAFQENIDAELNKLKKQHAASMARINEFKHRFLQLQHRTLRILVRQESIRKLGISIEPEEEFLKGKLETMYAHLNVPTQFKGQLNELISTVKLMENTTRPSQPQYKLVAESQNELKEYLQLQQNGIAKLVDIVKEDMRSLTIISEGMRQILQNKHSMA